MSGSATRRVSRALSWSVVLALGLLSNVGPAVAGSPSLPLRTVADLTLGGRSPRFDYQSIDPAARRLYIAHQGDGTILIVDVAHRRMLGRIGGLPNVHGVLVVPALHRLFATAQGTASADHDRHPQRPRSQPHSRRGRAGRHRVRPDRTARIRLGRASRGSAHRRRRRDGPRGRQYPARRGRRQRPVRPCRQARAGRRRDAGRARAHRPRDAPDHPPRSAPGLRGQPQPGGRRCGSAVDRRLLVQRSPARPRRRLVPGSRVDPPARDMWTSSRSIHASTACTRRPRTGSCRSCRSRMAGRRGCSGRRISPLAPIPSPSIREPLSSTSRLDGRAGPRFCGYCVRRDRERAGKRSVGSERARSPRR